MATKIKVRLMYLQANFYVRHELNQDRVDQMADLYIDNMNSLPPVQVSKVEGNFFMVIDGRHRHAAMLKVNEMETGYIDEVEVELLPPMSDIQLKFLAMRANAGGALPPTIADIRKVVTELTAEGVSRKKILEELGPAYGVKVIRTACDYAQTNVARLAIDNAIAAVDSGDMTLKEAAEKFGVDIAKLKHKKDKGKLQETTPSQEANSVITGYYKRLNLVIGQRLSGISRDVMDGICQPAEFVKVLAAVDKEVKNQERIIENWRERVRKQPHLQQSSNKGLFELTGVGK